MAFAQVRPAAQSPLNTTGTAPFVDTAILLFAASSVFALVSTAPKSALLEAIDELTYARDMCQMISESHDKPAGSTAHVAAEKIIKALARLNTLLAEKAAA